MIENYLYYGDNLEIMKKLLDEKGSFIDLVYIDPPFNSKEIIISYTKIDGTNLILFKKKFLKILGVM